MFQIEKRPKVQFSCKRPLQIALRGSGEDSCLQWYTYYTVKWGNFLHTLHAANVSLPAGSSVELAVWTKCQTESSNHIPKGSQWPQRATNKPPPLNLPNAHVCPCKIDSPGFVAAYMTPSVISCFRNYPSVPSFL